jgi:hypothetical protein
MVAKSAKKASPLKPSQRKITSFLSNKENTQKGANGSVPPGKTAIVKSPRKSPQKALKEDNAISGGFLCVNCPTTFTTIDGLAKHSKTCCKPRGLSRKLSKTKKKGAAGKGKSAGADKLLECDHCEKTFNSRHNHTIHMAAHLGIKNYECQICKNRFGQNSHLTVHMRTHTKERPYKCDLCPKAFTVSNALTVHRRIHTGERPYVCDICNKGFTESSKLTIHKRSHTDEKPFECEVCHDRFKQLNNMKKHMENFHTLEGLEAKYECDLCQKKFKMKNYLKVHMKYHTGDKEHNCEVCPKSFITRSELSQHMNYHNGIKPFKCEICQKDFYQAPHLKHHMKMHNSGKIQCNNCKRFFHKDSKFQHRCLPPSRSVSAKTHKKIAMKQAKMGHGVKVARVNKPQIEDELTQTGFEVAPQEVNQDDDQITIIENLKPSKKAKGRKQNKRKAVGARPGRPPKQAKTGTAMTELVMIDDIKEEPEEETADEAVDSLLESSRVKVQRIYSVGPQGEDDELDDMILEEVIDDSREGSATPEMRKEDEFILGDEEGIITFNPQEDTGVLLNNENFTVVIQHDFENM